MLTFDIQKYLIFWIRISLFACLWVENAELEIVSGQGLYGKICSCCFVSIKDP